MGAEGSKGKRPKSKSKSKSKKDDKKQKSDDKKTDKKTKKAGILEMHLFPFSQCDQRCDSLKLIRVKI